MLIVPPPKVRNHRKAAKRAAVVPALPQLTLQSATYDPDELIVTLYFEEGVDDSGLDGSQVSVNDPVTNNKLYLATGDHEAVDNYLEIQLEEQGPASGAAVVLNAGAGTGIVGSGDGATWAGVSDVVLPFGE